MYVLGSEKQNATVAFQSNVMLHVRFPHFQPEMPHTCGFIYIYWTIQQVKHTTSIGKADFV